MKTFKHDNKGKVVCPKALLDLCDGEYRPGYPCGHNLPHEFQLERSCNGGNCHQWKDIRCIPIEE